MNALTGPPPKPSEAGSVGRGRAKERSAVFAVRRKRSEADFALTRFAETYRPADGYRGATGPFGRP